MSTAARSSEFDALIDDLTVDACNDEEQLVGFRVGAGEALQSGKRASIVGVEVEVVKVDAGPDTRTSLTARVQRDGHVYEMALTDLTFAADSQLGRIVSAYRRWQGRTS